MKLSLMDIALPKERMLNFLDIEPAADEANLLSAGTI